MAEWRIIIIIIDLFFESGVNVFNNDWNQH